MSEIDEAISRILSQLHHRPSDERHWRLAVDSSFHWWATPVPTVRDLRGARQWWVTWND